MFWACHVLIWLNFIYYMVYVFLAIFYCTPIEKGWSQRIDPPVKGSCLDLRVAYTVGAAINTASDLSIVLLPQPLIWKLNLSCKKKIGLCGIFLIGLLWVEDVYFTLIKITHHNISACASSTVRLYYAVILNHYEDRTYLAGVLNLWAIAETTCGILTMCLPVSPRFFESLQVSKVWSNLIIFLRCFPRFKPVSKSSKASGKRTIRDDHRMEISWNLSIMRTVHMTRDRYCCVPNKFRESGSRFIRWKGQTLAVIFWSEW